MPSSRTTIFGTKCLPFTRERLAGETGGPDGRIRDCANFGRRVVIGMNDRETLEVEFIAEILRIVGPGANPADYVVAPNTSDELLEIRLQRLRELPSGIGHDELMRRVGPQDAG